MLNNSSNAWQLDKTLATSQHAVLLRWLGWGLAVFAILFCGLSAYIKITLLLLLVVAITLARRYTTRVSAVVMNPNFCALTLTNGKCITLSAPYRSAHLVWWISLYQPKRLRGRWYWLFRDQFTVDEWRTLSVLTHWSH